MQGETDIRKVIETAMSTVRDLFGDCWGLRLEEVKFDDTSHPEHWDITVSFTYSPPMGWSGHDPDRAFKVVRIKDINGQVASITNREFRAQD